MMTALFGFGFIYVLFHVIVWILVIWLIIWVLRSIFGHPVHGHRRQWMNTMSNNFDSSMRVLRERYAKGEITKEQFEQMKKDLE